MRIIILLFSYYLSFSLAAQTSLEVRYFKPLEAVGGGYLEQNTNFILQCNKQGSLFVLTTADNVESSNQNSGGDFDLNIWLRDGESWVFKDYADHSLTELATSIQENTYTIEDTLHPMQWQISKETKDIQGVVVQKARCEHRGRAYTAWFAPSIPINNGPWKLGGLPGLILEAYDDEKEVVFLFKSLQKIQNSPIRKPKSKGRKVSLATYLELAEKEYRQYLDFLEGRLKSTGSTIDIDANFTKFSSWEYLK